MSITSVWTEPRNQHCYANLSGNRFLSYRRWDDIFIAYWIIKYFTSFMSRRTYRSCCTTISVKENQLYFNGTNFILAESRRYWTSLLWVSTCWWNKIYCLPWIWVNFSYQAFFFWRIDMASRQYQTLALIMVANCKYLKSHLWLINYFWTQNWFVEPIFVCNKRENF